MKARANKVKIVGPRCFAWGSFGLMPCNDLGQHEQLINVWTRIEPDGTKRRFTSRAKARDFEGGTK